MRNSYSYFYQLVRALKWLLVLPNHTIIHCKFKKIGKRGRTIQHSLTRYTILIDPRLSQDNLASVALHELAHIQQLTSNKLDLQTTTSNCIKFNGVIYSDNELYYDRPWELDAFSTTINIANKINEIYNDR